MAIDAYGNWISGITQAPVTPPNSLGKLRHGEGVPAAGLGNVGDGYINTSNGDYYTKKESGWELQAGGGGGGTVQVIANTQANPNSPLITPDDPSQGAVYTRDGSGLTELWRWDVTAQAWGQVTG